MVAKKDHLVQNIGDTTAAAAGAASFIVEIGQVLLILLSVGWFILRLINWYRSNYLDKDSWKGM